MERLVPFFRVLHLTLIGFLDRSLRMKSAYDILKDELSLRRMKNSAYSLRAFARDLGVSVTALSDFLTQKRNLSKTNLLKICHSLNLSPIDRASLLHRRDAPNDIQSLKEKDDAFRLFSEWYCFAILNLPRIKTHRATPEWIAARFGISIEQAEDGLSRLQRLQLIRIRNGKIQRTKKNILTHFEVPDTAIKTHHQRVLQKAEQALLHAPAELREFSTTIIAFDPIHIETAKKRIQKIKGKLAKTLENKQSQDFFGLTLQLFPLSINKQN